MNEEKNNRDDNNIENDKTLKDKKVICALSYISILWIVGLFVDQEDPDVRFHVNQGIILSIFTFIGYMAVHIIDVILFSLARILTIFSSLLSVVYAFLIIAFIIVGIMNVYQDRRRPLPIIGSWFTILK